MSSANPPASRRSPGPCLPGGWLARVGGLALLVWASVSLAVESQAQVLVDEDFEGLAPTSSFTVTPDGSTGWSFAGMGTDPPLTLERGSTYTFTIAGDATHPFWITTAAGTGGSGAYNVGVIGNGATNGTVTFDVQPSAPDSLYYDCGVHLGQGGVIDVVDAGTLPGWESDGPTTGSFAFEDSAGDGVLRAISTRSGSDRFELVAAPELLDLTARVEVQAWDSSKLTRAGILLRWLGTSVGMYEISFTSDTPGSRNGVLRILARTPIFYSEIELASMPFDASPPFELITVVSGTTIWAVAVDPDDPAVILAHAFTGDAGTLVTGRAGVVASTSSLPAGGDDGFDVEIDDFWLGDSTSDLDGDGYADGAEVVAGSDPLDDQSIPGASEVPVGPGARCVLMLAIVLLGALRASPAAHVTASTATRRRRS